jgi:hypothetical protein
MSNEDIGNLRSASKHIDSHVKPFRCRKPGCANQAFSSVACRLRHEREMHKMHNMEEFLCRYDGPCERKQCGNGFARSFNRGDHEKRVHHIFQENPRTKGRPKGASRNETSNVHSTLRVNSDWCKRRSRSSNNTSYESSTSTIGATGPSTSSEPTRLNMYPTSITAPLEFPSFAGSPTRSGLAGPWTVYGPTVENPSPTVFDFSSPEPTKASNAGVKSTGTYGSTQSFKKRRENPDQWAERVHRLRDLTSRLPDVPDESSHNILRSIEQEARELRAIDSDIDFRPAKNPKSRVEHAHRLRDGTLRLPTTSFVSPTSALFSSSTSVPIGYPFERFSANVDVTRIAGPVDDSSDSMDNAATVDSSSVKTCIGELTVSRPRQMTLLKDFQYAF